MTFHKKMFDTYPIICSLIIVALFTIVPYGGAIVLLIGAVIIAFDPKPIDKKKVSENRKLRLGRAPPGFSRYKFK